MASKVLPPGFRFHPTDVELVMYYLKRKILGRKLHFEAITEVDIYACNPDDLPAKTCMKSGDQKWYFFCPREKRYMKGERAKRSTPQGFWKTTGNDRPVLYNGECAGKIKTLIFHRGKAPKGERTDWVMHEYRITEQGLGEKENEQDTFVLCRIFQKEGLGPRNGAQYGAPFKEEDWDEEVDVALPSEMLLTVTSDPKNQNLSAVECVSSVPQSSAIVSFPEVAPSDTVQELPHHPDENVVTEGAYDDLLMFGLFADEILNAPDQNVGNEELGGAVNESNCEAAAPNVNEIYNELDDLCNFHGSEWAQHEQPLYSPLGIEFHESLAGYMELSDLDNPLLFTQQLSVGPVTDELAPSSEGTNLFDDSNQSSNVVVGPIAEVAPLPDGTHLLDGYPASFFQEMSGGDSSSVYDASPSAGFQEPTSPVRKRKRQPKVAAALTNVQKTMKR